MMEAIFKREIVLNKVALRIIGVMTFVILTALGAFVRIPLPFTPVPITLQTFFVLLSGIFLGSSGVISQAIYILLGLAGLPIFSGAGSGLTYLSGPTAGYIFGFVFATLFLGRFIKLVRINLFSILGILCLADLIILFSGILWLKLIFGLSFKKLLFIGFFPFLPGDLLKAWVAATLYLRLEPRIKELF